MPANTTRYGVANPNIVSESFEDEVVVVNLDSGFYFSLEGSGALCWELATSGLPIGAILEEVRRRHEAEATTVDGSVRAFLEELVSEGLLTTVEVDNGEIDAGSRLVRSTEVMNDTRPGFSPPVINRYSDMRQLLLIDPVHMVTDSGWPATDSESPADHG